MECVCLWQVSHWLESQTNHSISIFHLEQSFLPETQFSHLGKEHGNAYLIWLLLRFKGMWKVTSLPAWHTSMKLFFSHPISLLKEVALYSYPRKSRQEWSYCANLMGHTLRSKGGREKSCYKDKCHILKAHNPQKYQHPYRESTVGLCNSLNNQDCTTWQVQSPAREDPQKRDPSLWLHPLSSTAHLLHLWDGGSSPTFRDPGKTGGCTATLWGGNCSTCAVHDMLEMWPRNWIFSFLPF